MKITKCIHVTATEKRHLKAFLKSHKTKAKINTKYYTILYCCLDNDEAFYKIEISTPYINDYGVKKYDTQIIELIK